MDLDTDLLSHPAYNTSTKLPKYNCAVTVFSAVSSSDAAKVLRKLNPAWTHADHAELANKHGAMAIQAEERYRELLDIAAQATFGRPFHFTDYKISAIGSEEFSDEHKNELRKLAHSRGKHRTCEQAHVKASSRRFK